MISTPNEANINYKQWLADNPEAELSEEAKAALREELENEISAEEKKAKAKSKWDRQYNKKNIGTSKPKDTIAQ